MTKRMFTARKVTDPKKGKTRIIAKARTIAELIDKAKDKGDYIIEMTQSRSTAK